MCCFITRSPVVYRMYCTGVHDLNKQVVMYLCTSKTPKCPLPFQHPYSFLKPQGISIGHLRSLLRGRRGSTGADHCVYDGLPRTEDELHSCGSVLSSHLSCNTKTRR